MKIADNASIDDNTHGGGEIPPCTGLTPDAFPEVQQQTTTLKNLQSGVSTRNAPSGHLKNLKRKPNEAFRRLLNNEITAFLLFC